MRLGLDLACPPMRRNRTLVARAAAIVGPNDLLGVWPLYGSQLVTHDTVVQSPTVFDASPPWTSVRLSAWPDANTLREDATAASSHYVEQTLVNAVGPVAAVGWDVAPDGRDWVCLQLQGTANAQCWFNVTTGAVGTQTGCVGSVAPQGGGIIRCSLVPTSTLVFAASSVLRAYSSSADGSVSHNGDIAKGLKLYSATIGQTSLLTAPNLYGAYTLARYVDRFDLTNATKASEPVLDATGWNGLPCGRFSGANYLTADAVAAQFTGEDKPLTWAFAQEALTANKNLASIANSADANPVEVCAGTSANTQRHVIRDATGAVKYLPDGSALISQRSVLLQSMTGVAVDLYRNAAAELAGADRNVGTVNLNQYTLGVLRYNGLFSAPYDGRVRLHILAKRALTQPEAVALSNLVMAYCPIG